MKAAKSLSFETSTWEAIEKHMQKEGITEVSAAAEDLLLAGVEAKKKVSSK